MHSISKIVALAALLAILVNVAQAVFPQGKQFCTVEGCKEPPPDLVNRILQQENQVFGQGGAQCGDGKCNIVAGETCATCAKDCGACKLKSAFTKCKNPKQWVLTFDDGPSKFTPSLVKTLNDAKAPACFFPIGNSVNTAGDEAVNGMKLAFESGHEIGSHTYTHRSLSNKILIKNGPGDEKALPAGVQDNNATRLSFLRAEMIFTDEAIFSNIKKRVRFVRPPFLDVTPETISQMETMGYLPININVDSLDFTLVGKDNANPQTVLKQLKDAFAKKQAEGSWISLQHDIHEFSVQAVKDIIDFVRSQNAELVSMSQCIGENPYREDNANIFLSPEAAKNAPGGGGGSSGGGGSGRGSGSGGSSSDGKSRQDGTPPATGKSGGNGGSATGGKDSEGQDGGTSNSGGGASSRCSRGRTM